MIIAINGKLGAGKSAVAHILKDRLGLTYVSTGAWFREIAAQRGLTVGELSALAEKDRSIDEQIDNRLKAFNDVNDGKNYIIDSRMAPVFIKEAFRVRLMVSEATGSRRIFYDVERGSVERFEDEKQALAEYRNRAKSETRRYKEMYGVDLDDAMLYDIVMKTDTLTAEEVADVLEAYIGLHR